jgi:peptidyl-prolyl cis-trans isomerase D
MMKFLRSQSQTVLVLVLVFIAVGFLFYGNAGNLLSVGMGRASSNDFGRIDGEDLTIADLYDSVRETRDWFLINGGNPAQLRQAGATTQVARIAWGQLLLQREAERLHINIGNDETLDFISKFPRFQKNGGFDLATYNDQMKELQVMLHVAPEDGSDPVKATKDLFEKLVRNQLGAKAAQRALFNSVRTPSQDVDQEYAKRYSPVTVSYVTFDPKMFAGKEPISQADLEKEYQANPTNPAYRTQEKRKVDYVLFMLPPDQQKLPDDQKAVAKDALGQKALTFVLAFQPNPSADTGTTPPVPGFLAEAQKESLTSGTTDFFAEDQPAPGVPPSSAFNQAAFSLSKDNSISKVVELENGVAVLHLAEIQPSDLRPLAEIKDLVQKDLLAKLTAKSLQDYASFSSKGLQEAVAKGTLFAKAAADAHEQVTTLPAFVPAQAGNDPKLGMFAEVAYEMKDNAVSAPFELENGQMAVLHVDSRAKPDQAGFADFEKAYRAQADQTLRQGALQDWVTWKSHQTGTRIPPQLDAYGSVE